MSGCREVRREGGSNSNELNHDIKNLFKWSWLEEKNHNNTFLLDYIRKVNIPGKVLYNICNTLVQ